MFRKKDPGNSPKVEQSVAKAVSYEITVADMARRSERRAWWVATGSLLMSLALAGGYYYMLPLKEKVPFLVMADAYTGTATVARLSGTFQGETITTNEAINRSNVAQYVLARESYDSAVMGLRDWELVFVMSTDPVAQSMRVRYAGNNPQNPFVMYGRERAIRVKILSITPLGAGERQLPRRFGAHPAQPAGQAHRRLYLPGQPAGDDALQYNQNLALSEQDRILNPLAFQVTEYRVDNDYRVACRCRMTAPCSAGGAAGTGRTAGAGCLRSQQSGRGHHDRSRHRPAGRGAGQVGQMQPDAGCNPCRVSRCRGKQCRGRPCPDSRP
jgi:type IV secretion system protein VirB8